MYKKLANLYLPTNKAGSRVSFRQSDCTACLYKTGSRISFGQSDCTLIDSLGVDVHDLYLIITIPDPPEEFS